MFVEVAVNIPPVHGTFDYHVPEPYQASIFAGLLVEVPFGNRQVQGIVTRCMDRSAIPETSLDGL
jgi:primosomal protein N' (replication factor Y)